MWRQLSSLKIKIGISSQIKRGILEPNKYINFASHSITYVIAIKAG